MTNFAIPLQQHRNAAMCACTFHNPKKVFKRANQRGSFLLEAILSVVILASSLTVIIQAMSTNLRASVYSGDYTKAMFFAENKMIELIQNGFIAAGLSQEDNFPQPHSRFHYSLTSEAGAIKDSENINRVKLAISWQRGLRHNRMVLETYLFDLPDESP